MRIIVTLLFAAVAATGSQPHSSDKTEPKVSINKLSIESSTFPDEDRVTLSRAFEHKSFDPDELQERLYLATRDLGYFRSVISKPILSNSEQTSAIRESDITVRISEGPRYHMGRIRFQGGATFTDSQKQSAFCNPARRPVLCNKNRQRSGRAANTLWNERLYQLRGNSSADDR